MNQADIDFLFWHAVAKVRVGQYQEANTIFHVIEAFHEDATLGRAYCYIRQGDFGQALSLLNIAKPPVGRAFAIHKRLVRRCEKEMINEMV